MDDGALTTLRVVANVGTHHQVDGHLDMLFEEAVESQVGIGVSNGAVVDAGPSHHIRARPRFRPCTCISGYRSVFPIQWAVDRRRLGCYPLRWKWGC